MGVSVLLLGLWGAALLGQALRYTGGRLVYPLDDPYIHMAVARHFVEDGVWGVSSRGFSSTTSSPLWTAWIALGFRLLGVREEVPLLLNVLVASALLLLLDRRLRAYPPLSRTALLLLLLILAYLPVQALTGMEHLLHALLTVLFFYGVAEALDGGPRRRWGHVPLLLTAAFLPLVRYEGLFALLVGVGLLAAWGGRRLALLVAASGASLVSAYGWISVRHGWFFLPNTVLLKGVRPRNLQEGILFLIRPYLLLRSAPHLLMLLMALIALGLWGRRKGLSRRGQALILMYVGTLGLHVQFARLGVFYRYEAYLTLTGLLLLADLLRPFLQALAERAPTPSPSEFLSWIGLVLLGFLPLAVQAGEAFGTYPRAVKNIYEQQLQMAAFLGECYSGSPVALNDIGAVSFYTEAEVLDLVGLANMEVARKKLRGTYDAEALASLVRRHEVEIILVYDAWFEGQIPAEWIPLGRWQIQDNVVAGDDAVSFYVPSERWLGKALDCLRAFDARLPADVSRSGAFVPSEAP